MATAPKPSIAPTVHYTKPTDVVPGVDVYTDSRQTPINNITKQLGDWTTSLLKNFGGNFPKNDLLKVTKFAVTLVKDRKTALNQLSDFSKDAARNLGGAIVGNVLINMGVTDRPQELVAAALNLPGSKSIEEAVMGANPSLRLFFNDDVKKLIKGDYSSAKGLSDLLIGITGNQNISSMFDATAQFALLNEMINTARVFALPEVYDTALAQIKEEDDKRAFVLQAVPAAASSADVAFLNKAIDLSSITAIKSLNPLIAEQLVAGYRRKEMDTNPTVEVVEFLNLLNRIEPNWDNIQVGTFNAANLELYSKASSDLSDTFLLMPAHSTNAAIAKSGKYQPDQTAVDIFTKMYPLSGLAKQR